MPNVSLENAIIALDEMALTVLDDGLLLCRCLCVLYAIGYPRHTASIPLLKS
jgi:hypothetical protein